jgi:eukaryotic-like serine/threonine-protein kinase
MTGFVPPTLATALAERYALRRELGAGGMAIVYLARDVKHEREVAIKVLRAEVAGTLGGERFLREIRLAARLSHPHILPLFDSGEADGTLWYTMPVVDGESLRTRLEREGRLPVEEAVRLATDVADALAYAHAQGIVHRDVKPENILLQGGAGAPAHAFVADFGIGKATGDADASGSLTQLGMTVGTPAYMSPEQAVGEAVDGRSDLYALGCVLHEMLVGEPPFTGPNAQAILAKRFVQLPADVSALREGVPRPVAVAVQRALQRTPIDRPAAAEWARALRTSSSSPALAAVEPTAPALSIAVLPFASLSDDRENEYFGDGVAEEIIDTLARVPGLFVAARVSAAVYKGRQVPLATIGRELNVSTVLQGSVRRAGGRVRITAQLVAVADGYQLWSERYDRDLTDVFAVQDEIAGAIARRLELQFAPATVVAPVTTAQVDAYELVVRGRALTQQRGRAILEGVRCLERALELVPDHVEALVALGAAQRAMGQYLLAPPESAYERARATLERALALAPSHAEAMGYLAMVRFAQGAPLKPTLALWEKSLALDPRLTEVRALYAAWGLGIGGDGTRGAQAERELPRALEEDPLNATVATIGALVLPLLGHGEEAPGHVRRVLEILPEAFAPTYAHCYTLNWAGRASEALVATEDALDRFGRHPWLLHNLVGIYMRLDDRRRADAVYTELAARAVTSRIPHFSLAFALMYLGRLDEALDEAHRSIVANDAPGRTVWLRWGDLHLLQAHDGYDELAAAVRKGG